MSKVITDIDIEALNIDQATRELLGQLLNHMELLWAENQKLRVENQELKDEIARLKGHKGKPDIKPNCQPESKDKQKNRPQAQADPGKEKAPRPKRISIDREQTIKCDRTLLPTDLRHRGYREAVIQNILFQRDNILYRLERLYSESTQSLYEADLPFELQGQRYGSELRAFVIMLYFELRVPQEKILKLLQSQGIVISAGEISNILIHKHLEEFSAEQQAVLKAGLASTSYQHIDDTSMRVDGKNQYVTALCNPYYTSFFTNQRKNRETVSLLLSQLEQPGQSIATSVAQADRINQHLRDYIKILVSDDAGQFSQLTTHRALCWIHEGRLYEKLTPYLKSHRRMVEKFLTEFWDFYQKLKLYQRQPTREFKNILNNQFDRLFSQRSTYQALADRIALTKQKKQELLLVLDFPEVPVDNNQAERALREYVIKRKISNGTRTAEGTRAWEIFLSLVDTCRKNSVNFYQYILDRLKKSFQLPSLATVIIDNCQVALKNQSVYPGAHCEEAILIF